MLTRRRFVASILLTPLVTSHAAAQSDFGAGRPEERYFSAEARVGSGRRGPVAEGYVYNRYDVHANRVQLALTPVDATGKPLGSVTIHVGEVPPRSRTYFQAPVPPGSAGVTASVASFDWVPRGGGGGM
jgi:hypothetical protein